LVKPGVLTFYRIMAYVTAILLILLCLAMVLKYAHTFLPVWPEGSSVQQFGQAATSAIGTGHGFLYIVYLFIALVTTVQLRVPLGRMVLVLLAGTIPFGAFVAERKVTHWYHRRQQGLPLDGDRSNDPAASEGTWSTSS
jgi:integral membrane protein